MKKSFTEIGEILDRLCAERATAECPLHSVRAQAQYLGVSAPQLSRLRNGLVPLTPKSAHTFASALARSPEEREELVRTFLRHSPSQSRDCAAVARAALALQIEGELDLTGLTGVY